MCPFFSFSLPKSWCSHQGCWFHKGLNIPLRWIWMENQWMPFWDQRQNLYNKFVSFISKGHQLFVRWSLLIPKKKKTGFLGINLFSSYGRVSLGCDLHNIKVGHVVLFFITKGSIDILANKAHLGPFPQWTPQRCDQLTDCWWNLCYKAAITLRYASLRIVMRWLRNVTTLFMTSTFERGYLY